MPEDTIIIATNDNREKLSKDIQFIRTFLYALDRASRENDDLAYVQIERKGFARSRDIVKQGEFDDLLTTKMGEYSLTYNAENRILKVDLSDESKIEANNSTSQVVIVYFNGPLLTRYIRKPKSYRVDVQYSDSLSYCLTRRNGETGAMFIQFHWSDPVEMGIGECEADLRRQADKLTDFDRLVSDFEGCTKRAAATTK